MMSDESGSELPVLTAPRDGVPDLINDAAGRRATLDALAAGHGPVALDVERAQSFRYSAKAYLLQLKREGSGSFLVDPVAFETEDADVAHFQAMQEVIGGEEWILHAASQDLPNLVALGLRPSLLFDTELAGRLLGLPRVSLGAMVEQFCGVRLLKEHSAVDWSVRPIPADWLNYAALDVELLHELREKLLERLTAAGKQEWARQEFEWLCRWAILPPATRPDRWRRTSGTHQVHTTRGLAIVRELWEARDEIAFKTDRAPGKVLPDKAITELAALVTRQDPHLPSAGELRAIEGFKRRNARAYQSVWLAALDRVAALPPSSLPPLRLGNGGIPAPRNWERANPAAFERWNTVRPAVVALAEELEVPVENLIAPDALRHLLWEPKLPLDIPTVSAQLADMDVRVWQQELVAPLVVELLA